MGSERKSQALEIWYRVLMSNIPPGVGLKGELMERLLMNLETDGCES